MSFINKDLQGQTYEQFCKVSENDFIGDDFISQLEWSMLITQGKMKQTHFMEGHPTLTMNHFDKCHLWGSSGDDLIGKDKYNFYLPFTSMQANPNIFPYVNQKILRLGKDYISLEKIRELQPEQKRGIVNNRAYKHIYENSLAFYDKEKESFYGRIEGFGVNPRFFELANEGHKDDKINLLDIVSPVCLTSGGYYTKSDLIEYAQQNKDWFNEYFLKTIIFLGFAYQIALTDYYQWMLYIKEYDNIGFIIPIDPIILPEIYNTSMAKFENRKAMLHFVRDHYRRKRIEKEADYSVFVNRYLRGENKFNYRGFSAEIIPPKYDMNRVKTRKKFIDI